MRVPGWVNQVQARGEPDGIASFRRHDSNYPAPKCKTEAQQFASSRQERAYVSAHDPSGETLPFEKAWGSISVPGDSHDGVWLCAQPLGRRAEAAAFPDIDLRFQDGGRGQGVFRARLWPARKTPGR